MRKLLIPFLLSFFLCWTSVFCDVIFEDEKFYLDGIDGPYIFDQGASVIVYEITETNDLNSYIAARTDTFLVTIPNDSMNTFEVTLQDSLMTYPDRYPEVDKIFAVSDIEGNFNALASLLKGNGVIDDNFNWSFGNGHLVMNGDLMDRGEFVTPVLWLFYKLEQQALDQDGMVHVILGNHEIIDLKGRTDYVQDKFIASAQVISGILSPSKALRYLFSEESELGAWLRTKNSIEKIGDLIFVHAGLSPELREKNYSIREINDSIRAYLGWQTNDIENDRARFLFRSFGPLWFRGMVMDYKDYYTKTTEVEVDSILAQFEVETVVIGHTVQDSVGTDYEGKIIHIDVIHPEKLNSGEAQALLIEKGKYYLVNDFGKRILLK